MKHAILSLGGKQYNIQENDLIVVPGNTIIDPSVLMFSDGKKTQVGDPTIKDFHIKLDVVEEKNGEKIQVKRFKSKSRYKKNHGHKQTVLVLRVAELGEEKKAEKVEKAEKEEKAAEPKKVEKKAAAPKKTVKAEK